MIMITHDLGIVAEVCDDVAIVYAGQIVEYGSKEEIFDHPTHPYTLGLFGAIPNLTEDVERLSPIPGMPPDPTALPQGCYFGPRCAHKCAECEKSVPMVEIRPGHWCRCCVKK
jgi:peptide/nickel transport system ATP-binding protein